MTTNSNKNLKLISIKVFSFSFVYYFERLPDNAQMKKVKKRTPISLRRNVCMYNVCDGSFFFQMCNTNCGCQLLIRKMILEMVGCLA